MRTEGAGKSLFADPNATAIARTHNAIRREINEIVGEMAPNSRGYLKRQSGIFNMQDVLLEKAAKQVNDGIQRQWQKLTGIMGTRSQFNNVAAGIYGVGGLGAAAMFAPIWTAGAAGLGLAYAGGKLTLSSKSRSMMQHMLENTDRAIKLIPKGASELGAFARTAASETGRVAKPTLELLQSLKADRAVLIQLLEEGQ